MGKKKEEQAAIEQEQMEIRRTKLPRDKEIFGLIAKLFFFIFSFPLTSCKYEYLE